VTSVDDAGGVVRNAVGGHAGAVVAEMRSLQGVSDVGGDGLGAGKVEGVL